MTEFNKGDLPLKKSEVETEKFHHLELKYGKEPKINEEDLWNWH